jgi:hypothetical protein
LGPRAAPGSVRPEGGRARWLRKSPAPACRPTAMTPRSGVSSAMQGRGCHTGGRRGLRHESEIVGFPWMGGRGRRGAPRSRRASGSISCSSSAFRAVPGRAKSGRWWSGRRGERPFPEPRKRGGVAPNSAGGLPPASLRSAAGRARVRVHHKSGGALPETAPAVAPNVRPFDAPGNLPNAAVAFLARQDPLSEPRQRHATEEGLMATIQDIERRELHQRRQEGRGYVPHPMEVAREELLAAADLESDRLAPWLRRVARLLPKRAPLRKGRE